MKENRINNTKIFTIDLLKGQGIPLKRGPTGIAIALITVMVPLLIAISLYGLYMHNKVVFTIKQQEMLKIQDKTAALSYAVKMQKTLEKEKVLYRACLSEVKASIGKFNQWSPVLATLTKELPASVVLTSLSVELDSIEKEVPKKDNPKKKVKINVPVTKLVLKVNNQGQEDCREEVKVFRDRLYASAELGPKLDNIAFSRRAEKTDEGKETVSYEIECLFKPDF